MFANSPIGFARRTSKPFMLLIADQLIAHVANLTLYGTQPSA